MATYRSFSAQSLSKQASQIVVSKPSGVADGDVLIVVLCHPTNPGTVYTPSGWTKITSRTSAPYTTAFAKIASSEGSSWTFTWANTIWAVAWCVAYSGTSTNYSDGVSTVFGSSTQNVTIVLPSITPAQSGDTLLTFCLPGAGGTGSGTGTSGLPTGGGTETNRVNDEQLTSTNIKRRLYLCDEALSSSGATGTRSSTLSSQAGTSWGNAGFMIALRNDGNVYTKDLTDTLTGSETYSTIDGKWKVFTDTLTGAENLVRHAGKALLDSLTGSDTLSRSRGYFRALTDSLTGSEIFQRVKGQYRTLSDSLTGSDTYGTVRGKNRNFSDSLTGTENYSRQVSFLRTWIETLTGSETFAKGKGNFRYYSDTLTGSDSLSKVKGWYRSFTDSLTGTETYSTLLTIASVLRRWTGTQWEVVRMKVYNGTQYIVGRVKYYNGTIWKG